MSAAVEPTQLSMYTAELTKKETELVAREAALREREIAVNVGGAATDTDRSTYVLSSILFILLVLILLNYTLDYLRAREQEPVQAV